jgi:hypothetical protein
MALDIAKFRSFARIVHNEDDPAIAICWAGAVRELEEKTGWCVESVTRTQWVPSAPVTIYGGLYLLLQRQGDLAGTTATYSDSATVPLTGTCAKIMINGLIYVDMEIDAITYPVTLTVTAGNAALNPLLELALLNRVAQKVAERGDDTKALDSTYWDRITSMMGKGIG